MVGEAGPEAIIPLSKMNNRPTTVINVTVEGSLVTERKLQDVIADSFIKSAQGGAFEDIGINP
jgi:hypothetical protein